MNFRFRFCSLLNLILLCLHSQSLHASYDFIFSTLVPVKELNCKLKLDMYLKLCELSKRALVVIEVYKDNIVGLIELLYYISECKVKHI